MKNKASVASLCIILVMVSFILVMRSTAGSTTAQSILSSQGTIVYPQQRYSYIIYQQSSTYYAKNGTSGQICWSSTNCSSVLYNAQLGGGQSIFITAGTYSLSNGFLVNTPNNFIYGAGNSTILTSTANISIVHLYYAWNTTIQDLCVVGSGTGSSQIGICIDNANYATVQNCKVLNTGADGIYSSTTNCATVTFNDIENTGACGIEFYSGQKDNIISNHTNMTQLSGIKFTGYNAAVSDSNGITDNIVEQYGSSSGGNGISLYLCSDSSVVGNKILNGTGSVWEGHGISVENESNYNTLSGNNIQNISYNGIDVSTSAGNIVSSNTVDTGQASGIETYLANNTVINSNIFENCQHDGIRLNIGSYFNTVEGNTIINCVQNGINSQNSSNNKIDDNTIKGFDTGNTGTFDGVCIANSSSSNSIYTNIISTTTTYHYGVAIEDNSCYNNSIWGNPSATILDNGIDTSFTLQ